MSDRNSIPLDVNGNPLYDLGNGVYVEWWINVDPDNIDGPGIIGSIVEHHWEEKTDEQPGHWAMGSIWINKDIRHRPHWDITSGEIGSFEHLTLMPSVLCKRCGLHGWIRDGKWVNA